MSVYRPEPSRPPGTATQPALKQEEETHLLTRLAGGDRKAAEDLVEHTYHQVFSALVKFCGGDTHLAADLTQETYRKAWQHLRTFDGRSKIATWLYRIAYTTFLNHIRRPAPLPVPEPPETPPSPNGPQRAEEDLLEHEERDRMRRAVISLPEDLRFTVTARYWADLTVREIAILERISSVAVRKRLKKALRLLSVYLEDSTP